MHQSERELDEALRDWPHLINQSNGMTRTPLHLAAGWPHGLRALLQHGARVDSSDREGYTPLYYAIYLGFFETMNLLMKAGCILDLTNDLENILWHVGQWFGQHDYRVWGVSQETRMHILDAAIALLTERRRDLQSRLAALPMASNIDSDVFQCDRILDACAIYAERVEDKLRGYDQKPRRASSLLTNCQTVYHVNNLRVDIAERIWQLGFRDFDFPDGRGMTRLMLSRSCDDLGLTTKIELCSWLIQKRAKLHRPQHGSLDYDP